MANYTVKRGDCLWSIAQKQLGNPYRWTEIADLNGISRSNPIIHPGQSLKMPGSSSGGGGSVAPKPSNTSRATIQYFGFQAGSENTVFAAWSWGKSADTESYHIKWQYFTGNDGVWFIGTDSKIEDTICTYDIPSNATHVRFAVRPIAKTKTSSDGKTEYSLFTAGWTDWKYYKKEDNPPLTPPVPTVSIEDYKLTAEISNLNVNATHIEFEVVKNNVARFGEIGTAAINTGTKYVSYSMTVTAGCKYKARCRSVRGALKSEWSEYSENADTIPSTPSKIISCKASSDTSVYLEWASVDNATSYDIEYATKKSYFDNSDQTETVTGIEFTHYEKTGLTAGEEYFFRVRAANSKGQSGWSEIKSTVIGKAPAAPTTWSSTTTAISGDPLTLYWVHNAEDGSSQTYAELELDIDGVKETHTIKNSTNEEDKDKTSSYSVNTTGYVEGKKIQWRVRTAGITNQYGDWSVQRTIDIYSPPTLDFGVTNSDGDAIDVLEAFPFYVSALAGPATQLPIGYHLVVKSNEFYETTDNIGNKKVVNSGEQIYSKYFDISEPLLVEMSASNIDLENNIEYTVSCTVAMNSGLTAEASSTFTVTWTDEQYEPNAEIGIDTTTYSAYIRPYLEIDGRNIIQKSDTSVYFNDWRAFNGVIELTETGFVKAYHTNDIMSKIGVYPPMISKLESGVQYTLSFEAYADKEVSLDYMYIMCENDNNFLASLKPTITTTPFTYVMNFGLARDFENCSIMVATRNMYANEAIYVRNIKVEKGSQATEWTPAPEDSGFTGVTLSVYRREFDGTFTELAKDLDDTKNTFVTDPHPALDYARYRIVAKTRDTGGISYYDVPDYPVGGKSAIIQWNEEWTNFSTSNEEILAEPPFAGSLLKLPYNIDVSDNRSPDVALVSYIGRRHPVGYYGTQVGETASWNMEIDKNDKETLYALRRLSIWMGDVYVREPSGSGYWANVKVSFSQTHCEVTIPVSLDITRVEGGV